MRSLQAHVNVKWAQYKQAQITMTVAPRRLMRQNKCVTDTRQIDQPLHKHTKYVINKKPHANAKWTPIKHT